MMKYLFSMYKVEGFDFLYWKKKKVIKRKVFYKNMFIVVLFY